MQLIDEDHITQAVIARHAGAEDARLRDVMTSLVQHLHAFVREVKLTEAEWHAGLRFLAEAGRAPAAENGAADELALLSDVLGTSMLVTALNRRKNGAVSGGAAAGGAGAGVGAGRGTEGRAALPGMLAPHPLPAAGPVAQLLRALGRED